MLGKIQEITMVEDFAIKPIAPVGGVGGRLGFTQMLNAICRYSAMDGYVVKTDQHTFYVLINNGQSCCENWGYFSSEDDHDQFIGANLLEVNLTDTALNTTKVEESDYYDDAGGIQFVNFVTDNGVFQLAVYNAHNGYYGHSILVAKDEEVLLNETL